VWWKQPVTAPKAKAIAYYRHSAQDRQENSIPIQQEQVRKFANENGIKIIREFKDEGKSGLSTEGRDDFNKALELVVDSTSDFEYVLVLDMSRWGRFQDIDMSAYYRGLCTKYGKKVVYTTIGFAKDDDLLHYMRLNIESYGAAKYSRELSDKVWRGCVKIAEQGFRAGGLPPYGLHRLLLDEQRKPVQILNPGQRKSIQNQRVTLAPGDRDKIVVIQRIFAEFAKKHREPKDIAELLNSENIPSPGDTKWSSGTVCAILTNELYIGTMVYNKTGQRLQSPTKKNPAKEWIRKEGAFEAIVDKELFFKTQEMLAAKEAQRQKMYSNEEMIARLKRLYHERGMISRNQIAGRKNMLPPSTYVRHFSSLDSAFQQMFPEVLDRTRQSVVRQLHSTARRVETFDDYFVLNDSFSLVIQPSVPVPFGYGAYWSFRPDQRVEVDITLGVPLSDNGHYDILGYLAFPRMLAMPHNIRLFSTSDGTLDMYGYDTLKMISSIS
jgi:DNA invertase Pin-like site-specific DNA recombinase